MKRRRLIALLTLVLAMTPEAVVAQSTSKVYRVGLLNAGPPLPEASPYWVGLVRGFDRHGYTLGRNLAFEPRGAGMRHDRLPGLVEDLLASKVDMIVATGYPAALAAKQGTRKIPVVVLAAGDTVGTGLVASLARPGANLTGISELATELSTKRLELLKYAVPSVRRVAMLWNAGDVAMTHRYRAAAAAAQSLGVAVDALGVREAEDFEKAFAAMKRDTPDGILVVSDTLTVLHRKRILDFAATQRLPVMYEYERYVRDGGLMAYGPDQVAMAERAADLVVRIFKGADPATLPVEQPARLKFIVNLKTAKALGLTIGPAALVRADEVIE
jgi:putative ABC transport system substrate-binding protein